MHQSRTLRNKVPEVTLAFWIIKMLSTTVGETTADFLIFDLGLGLVLTSLIMFVVLAVVLVFQLRQRGYVPANYWLAVVMISVVGTLVSDYLVDEVGIALETTTAVFSLALVAVFGTWFAAERTLSIHAIDTGRRELFYWSAILITFALGTSAGDLVAEGLRLGFGISALGFAVMIGAVYLAYRLGLDAVLAFWIAYILTRPFGASVGDLLAQPVANGGFGFGPTGTSILFMTIIAVMVAILGVRQGRTAIGREAARR